MEPIRIAEGMLLHHIPSQKFTTRILCVLLRRPLARREVTLNALLPGLLARGSAQYPTIRAIRQAAEAMDGAVFDAQIVKKGEQQILQFFLESATDGHDASALDFLQEVLLRPRLDERGFHAPYFEGECENLRKRIEGRINHKAEYANLKCLEALCAEEPFGLFGDGYAEDLPGVTPQSLWTFYRKIWAASAVDFIALGDWDAPWLQTQLAERFAGGLSSAERAFQGEPPPAQRRKARAQRQQIDLQMGSAQGNLCAALRGTIDPLGPDFVHFQLANEILGGGPNAKLFTNVREKESLCYAIYSTLYRFKSLLCIQAGTEPDKLAQVLQLAEAEVEALRQGRFSAEDLHSAQQSLAKRWRVLQDNPSACVDFYASQYLLGDRRTLDELLAEVDRASAEGVARTMGQLTMDTVVMLR